MHICESGLQQLGETGLPWCRLLALEIRRLLVLQFQLRQFQHQGLLPHCPLRRRPAQRERSQVWDGEPKSEHSVWGHESEGGAELDTLGLKRQKEKKVFSEQKLF